LFIHRSTPKHCLCLE